MQRTLSLALILIILLLVACDGAELTPTPFPATWTPAPALNPQQSYAIEIPELLSNSDSYVGAYVQVTGQYLKRPLLICESDGATNPSPATWEILDSSGVSLGAGEFDDALRSLVPNGLTVTVAGYWQQWEGPVGCGKQAEQETIWFLEVTDIISPSPIVQVTLTPSPIGGSPILSEDMITPDGVTNPGDGSNSTVQPVATSEDGLPVIEVTPLPTDATATAVSNNNGGSTNPTNTPTTGNNDATTPTATTSGNNGGGTIEATSTRPPNGGSGSTTATPQATSNATATAGSSGNPTPTPPTIGQSTSTPRPNSGNIIGMDDILGEDHIAFEYILPNEIHDWEVSLSSSTNITFSLIAEPGIDLGLELLDEVDNVLTSTNRAGANEIEEISNFRVDPNMDYYLRVFSDSPVEGNYIVLVWGNDGTISDARGYINYNQPQSTMIEAGEGVRHFWFFYGEEDETVSIMTTTTTGATLMLISMYDVNGDYMESDEDEILWIEEEVNNITLPEDGLYAFWLEEEGYSAADYTVSISKQ